MKLFYRGVTLIELVTAMVIASTVLLFLSNTLTGQLGIREVWSDVKLSEAGGTTWELNKLIKNFFSRATDFNLTQNGSDIAVVLRSDLRPCNTFNPETSSTNLSRISFLCCAPNVSMTAILPGGGNVNLTSACRENWGLTLNEWNSSNNLVTSRCFQNITALNVFSLGPQPLFNNLNAINFDLTAETHFINGQPSGRKRLFSNFAVSVGNSPNSPIVTCSRLGQFN